MKGDRGVENVPKGAHARCDQRDPSFHIAFVVSVCGKHGAQVFEFVNIVELVLLAFYRSFTFLCFCSFYFFNFLRRTRPSEILGVRPHVTRSLVYLHAECTFARLVAPRAALAWPCVVVQPVGVKVVVDQVRVEMFSGLPLVVLGSIALPSHQKGPVGRTCVAFHSEDLLDFMSAFSPALTCMTFATMRVKKHAVTTDMRAFKFADSA